MLLPLLLSVTSAHAALFDTQIYDLWPTSSRGDELRVLSLSDGGAYRINLEQTKDILLLEESKTKHTRVRLLTVGRIILDVYPAPDESNESSQPFDQRFELLNQFDYEPTRYATSSEVNQLYSSLNDRFKFRSQCYQRAHVWAWSLWNHYSSKSMKVFLFFTRKYIEDFNYKWWFHVSPFVMLNDQEMVLDYEFTNTPMNMQPWTNLFMKNDAVCPTVELYNDYALRQFDHYCYLRKVPMYYYQPADVELSDRTGEPILNFRQRDIDHAYRARKGD